MMPTTGESKTRSKLLSRLSTAIGMEVQPVGSYVTGLYLPTSDIDVVIIPPAGTIFSRAELDQFTATRGILSISSSLSCNRYFTNIEPVTRATVPVLRVADATSSVRVDITFQKKHSVAATKIVQHWEEILDRKHGHRCLRALVLVLKQFLTMRRLGNTYTGGINSYVLVWMVVAWMELEYAKRPVKDLGSMLMEFLKFYGNEFDYATKTIRINPQPSYGVKTLTRNSYGWERPPFPERSSCALCIYDPADPSIEMGGKVYAIKHVKETFADAYQKLKSFIQSGQRVPTTGLLGIILGGDYRKFLQARH